MDDALRTKMRVDAMIAMNSPTVSAGISLALDTLMHEHKVDHVEVRMHEKPRETHVLAIKFDRDSGLLSVDRIPVGMLQPVNETPT